MNWSPAPTPIERNWSPTPTPTQRNWSPAPTPIHKELLQQFPLPELIWNCHTPRSNRDHRSISTERGWCSTALLASTDQLFHADQGSIQVTINDDLDHRRRADLVKRYLAQLDDRTKQYRTQFDAIKTDIPSSAEVPLQEIERFVRKQTLSAVKTYLETVIALIKHAYMDRRLQLRFGQQKPNEKQVDLAFR